MIGIASIHHASGKSTLQNGDSANAIFTAAMQLIDGEGKVVFKEFEVDKKPPMLCVILQVPKVS